ncbi:MAG: acetyl-CoA carboxylase biotin carboxyl carrier protein [Acholeplasmataceae bacterium]
MKLSEIKSIIKDFESSKLTELELETNNVKLKLSKNKNPIIKTNKDINYEELNKTTNPKDTNKTLEINEDLSYIKSPLVGTFYESLKPGAKPFVKVGDKVKKGDVVCIVEAMKIMNEITSSYDGTISKITFKNGDVVGFEDVLFEVVK